MAKQARLATTRRQNSINVLESMKQDHLTCGICLEVLQTPKLLACSHSFCLQCIKSYVRRMDNCDTFMCPMCRSENRIPVGGIDELPTNYALNSMVADIDSYKQRHLKRKTNPESTGCQIHAGQFTAFWCADCNSAVCPQCVVETHRGHSFEALQDSPEPGEKGTGLKASKLCGKLLPKAENLVFSIDNEIIKNNKEERSLIADIDTRLDFLKAKLDEVGQKAKSKVQNHYANITQPLEDLKECAEESIEAIKEEAEDAKQHVQDEDEHLQEIRSLGMKLSTVETTFLKYASSQQDSITYKRSDAEEYRELEGLLGQIKVHTVQSEVPSPVKERPQGGGDTKANPGSLPPPPSYTTAIGTTPYQVPTAPQPYPAGHMVSQPYNAGATAPPPGWTSNMAAPPGYQPPQGYPSGVPPPPGGWGPTNPVYQQYQQAGLKVPLSLAGRYRMPQVLYNKTLDLGFGDIFDMCITENNDIITLGKSWFVSIRHQIKIMDFNGNVKAKIKKNIINIAYYKQRLYGLHEDKKMLYTFYMNGEVEQAEKINIDTPKGLAVDTNGNIYIGSDGKDKGIYRKSVDLQFEKWAYCNEEPYSLLPLTNGNFAFTEYSSVADSLSLCTQVKLLNPNGDVIWGFKEKNFHGDLTTDPFGNILLCNRDKNRVSVYSQAEGYHLGDLDPVNEKFHCPMVICKTHNNYLVIAQNYGSNIFICSFTGSSCF